MGKRIDAHIATASCFQFVLVDVGRAPQAVAQILREVMNLTITDVTKLREAMPLTLFEALEPERAAWLHWRFRLVGARAELRKPHVRHQGFRRPLFKGRVNPCKAA